MKLPVFVLAGLALALALAARASAKGLTIDAMLAMQRVSDPAVSPDGKRVVFAVRDTDMEANRGRTDVWIADLDGKNVRKLTTDPENDADPAWSPDGKWIYFTSSRGGSDQVWRVDPTGATTEQVTKLPLDVGGFKLFPDGKRLVVALDVWPAAKTIAASVKLDGLAAKAKTKAKIYDHLLFRHWDKWEDGRFSHLFVWTPPELGGKADDARDLMPGLATDSPTHPMNGVGEDVDISPDGKLVAYVIRNSGRENAWHTNTDIFLVPAAGGAASNLTAANQAYDYLPTFSPDGKSLALRMMVRPNFEADRERLAIVDLATKKLRVVTEAWDRSVGEITWSKDGKTIYTSTDNLGRHAIFAIDVASGKEHVLIDKGTNNSAKFAGDHLVYLHDALDQPTELWSMKLDGSGAQAITHLNDARTKAIQFGAAEQFSFQGAHGDTVSGWAIRPSGHDGKTKVPLAFLIHGGPQGSFDDHFHYRWNAQAFAGAGFGVVMIDFHGSTGYGQAFTDAIRGDWGGAPYEDLMSGLDAAIKKYAWIDGTKTVALGASYGGYMINWINGHTDRFKALVVHDGNLDERMAYFDTEELWFPEWEHGGTPWDKPDGYLKQNPIDFVKNWKTPTLVIHGGLDYRVIDTHGMATFTALQRKGIPSRFIEFPDENHWVLKPQNSKLWHEEVLSWIEQFTRKSGS